MSYGFLLFVSIAYLSFLFFIAFVVEKYWHKSARFLNTSLVYSLSLCAYCTAWTFYGSVGRASVTGIDFLGIYIGATIAVFLLPIIGRKMIRITKHEKINSVADFISSRYGKNTSIGAAVALLAVFSMIPYIGLQLKAISKSFFMIQTAQGAISNAYSGLFFHHDTTLLFTIILAFFIIIFGTKNIVTTERRPGLIATIAFESLIKLIAFLTIGVLVIIYFYRHWNANVINELLQDHYASTIVLQSENYPYLTWFSLIVLGALSFFFLPRQFHLGILENMDERHTQRAAWIFPLYLLLINLFVLPIALLGNILLKDKGIDGDSYVIMLPLFLKQNWLTIFVFLGGFSAATSMIIVSTLSLAYMVSNNLILPILLSMNKIQNRWNATNAASLKVIRNISIVVILLIAFLFEIFIAENISLVSIGLISFVGIAQLAPVGILSMYWKDANLKGALWAILSGFSVWAFCLILPIFININILPQSIMTHGLFGFSFLKPFHLFGVTGLDPITHGLLFSLSINFFMFVVVSLLTQKTSREIYQAEVFVDIFKNETQLEEKNISWRGDISNKNLLILLSNFLGEERSKYLFESYQNRHKIKTEANGIADSRMINFVEQILSSVIGAASARLMVESVTKEMPVNVEEMLRIIRESQQIISLNKELTKQSIELKKASVQLLQANDALKKIDEMKDEFLYTVTHEIRTPLTSIKALGEILYEHQDLTPEEKQKCLNAIVKETDRLSLLVSEVLNLEKYESGKYELVLSTFKLSTVYEQTIEAVSHFLKEKKIVIIHNLDEQDVTLCADKILIQQAFYNLITNAIKYVEPQIGKIEFLVEQLNPTQIKIILRDNGKGIPLEIQEQVFDKFFQVKNQLIKKPEGSGLGLAITKNIITLHQGIIYLTSQEQKGTTFYIELPLEQNTNEK